VDGTIKDQSSQNTTQQSQTPEPEGDSFLTKKDETKVETKDETKKPDAEGEKKDETKPEGAPEKYADFKLPDGYQFDKDVLGQAQAAFKELGLNQEGAQKLVDLYVANGLKQADAPYKAWADLQKQWTTEIAERFPGAKSTEVKSMIKGVITNVLSPSLSKNMMKALDITGAGSHPDIVEALSILLKPLSEGTPVRGNGPAKTGQTEPGKTEQVSIADAMYGHLRK
jgi:hypothetical protein